MSASVILLSGGLDSSANLALSAEVPERDRPVLALTINYGQRAAQQEIRAAGAFARHYGVRHQVLELPWLGALGGSSLTDSVLEMPTLAQANLDDLTSARKTAKAVWVPNRNGIMIATAAAFAEREGCDQVVVGFNREEAATFPDNSVEFLERSTAALALSTANGVRVTCYTALQDKREIVASLAKLARPFPFELIWSCYQGGEKPCGRCESCERLSRALASVGEKSMSGIGGSFKTVFSDRERAYTGVELRPHFLLTELKLQGSGIGAFIGPCFVNTEHLVDWEDRMAQDRIEAKRMVHFIGEFFGAGLREGVLIQRLLMAIAHQLLRDQMSAGPARDTARRDGDDLFVLERKLSVSIATATPVSQILHVGINVDPAGAPVPAIGLAELGAEPVEFAQELLRRFAEEWASIEWACVKVRPMI